MTVVMFGGRRASRRGEVVGAADAFFSYVDAVGAPQVVGGLGILASGGPAIEDVRSRVEAALEELPAFRRRLQPASRWRRPRWIEVATVDLGWHVCEERLRTTPGRQPDLDRLYAEVAELAATPLPADRPLWRLILVRGLATDQSAMVLLAHHTVADGLGVIASACTLLDPRVSPARSADAAANGRLRRAWATILGVAQLATDGSPRAPLTDVSTGERQFHALHLDMADVRRVAQRHGCRVTDVLLAAVAGSVSQRRQDLAVTIGSRLRVAVPLQFPDPRAVTGNVTAGVMVDLPLEPMPEPARLALIAARTRRLRTPSRAMASRMVVARALGLAPVPLARWFARTVYGHRFFHAIVTNLGGPREQLYLAGAAITEVIPIVPLAPGAPLAVGALGWTSTFGIGVVTDPSVLSADDISTGMADVLSNLAMPG